MIITFTCMYVKLTWFRWIKSMLVFPLSDFSVIPHGGSGKKLLLSRSEDVNSRPLYDRSGKEYPGSLEKPEKPVRRDVLASKYSCDND
jgi:hypothetical protein